MAMKNRNGSCLAVLALSIVCAWPELLSGTGDDEAGAPPQTSSDIVFAEDFETGTLNDIVNRWNDRKNVAGMSLTADVPPGTSGTRSLQITSLGGSNNGGHLYKLLSPGYDQLYYRYYIKYASTGTYHHTGGWFGGYNPPTAWPQGGAGVRPTGNERFSAAAEPVASDGRFDFYTYWMRMRGATDGYWGNDFIQDPNLKIARNQWMCVEIMVKLNNPVSSYNGEMALWVNGRKVGHLGPGFPNGTWNGDSFFPDPNGTPFEGFQWRSDPALNLNWFLIQHYETADPAGFVGRIWVDHLVVSKSYIGPVGGPPTDTEPPAPPSNVRVK